MFSKDTDPPPEAGLRNHPGVPRQRTSSSRVAGTGPSSLRVTGIGGDGGPDGNSGSRPAGQSTGASPVAKQVAATEGESWTHCPHILGLGRSDDEQPATAARSTAIVTGLPRTRELRSFNHKAIFCEFSKRTDQTTQASATARGDHRPRRQRPKDHQARPQRWAAAVDQHPCGPQDGGVPAVHDAYVTGKNSRREPTPRRSAASAVQGIAEGTCRLAGPPLLPSNAARGPPGGGLTVRPRGVGPPVAVRSGPGAVLAAAIGPDGAGSHGSGDSSAVRATPRHAAHDAVVRRHGSRQISQAIAD